MKRSSTCEWCGEDAKGKEIERKRDNVIVQYNCECGAQWFEREKA